MDKLDILQLIELTNAGKYDEAAVLVKQYFEKLSPAQKGRAYIAMGTAYTQLMAENNEQLTAILDKQLGDLRALDSREKREIEELDLSAVRDQLKE